MVSSDEPEKVTGNRESGDPSLDHQVRFGDKVPEHCISIWPACQTRRGSPGTRHEIRRTLDHMATSGNRGGGQRSKGDRRFVGSRVPVDVYDRLAQTAKAENLTVSEFVAALIGEKLGPEASNSLRLQGELPIGRIA